MTMATATTGSNISEKWNIEAPNQNLFTGDQVIDAYLSGKKDGLRSAEKVILDRLDNNVDNSGTQVLDLLKFLDRKNISGNDAYLKINSWKDLSILISVKESDFYNESFLNVYEFVEHLEETLNSETCHVEFSFVDFNEKLNDYNLHCDGYVLKYNKPS
ncbi:hypothetical protein [Pedobacter rhizosphaerae]|uniref:Uncharacterized protein n=1 Tax=Pedobacter rhizosphaerae TaxID=390241 RepID=A0A1H9TTF8_9SPHI|nr:hypothetical protein [Pedobacter rhizosphaerae]SES00271.1 hypothetical protein SAMN04488023_12473 [Pedobacter rhizosphaerae]